VKGQVILLVFLPTSVCVPPPHLIVANFLDICCCTTFLAAPECLMLEPSLMRRLVEDLGTHILTLSQELLMKI